MTHSERLELMQGILLSLLSERRKSDPDWDRYNDYDKYKAIKSEVVALFDTVFSA